MTDARESNNAATQAHQLIAGLRAANQGLRSTEYHPDPRDTGPIGDDDYIKQYAIDTGWHIDANGNAIGKVEGWVPPGTPGRGPDGTMGATPLRFPEVPQKIAAIAEKGDSMFGKSSGPFVPGARMTLSQIKGVDLEAGEVIVDGYRWPMAPEEVTHIARYCIQCMVREIQNQISALAADYGIEGVSPETPKAEDAGDPVSAVQAGEDRGRVPSTSGKVEGEAAVVPSVPAEPSKAYDRRSRGPTTESA